MLPTILLLFNFILAERFEMTVDKSMLHNISTGLLKSDMGFLKELIINSIDANRKLSIAAKDDQAVLGRDILIELTDTDLIIKDGGIGMNKKELQDYIGKFGGSGSRETAECTGKFGMGFYSSFVAAHEVTIISKKWNEKQAYRFVLEFGSLEYEISEIEKEDFGTTVILKLREEFKKQIDEQRISDWITSNLLDAGINNLFNVYFKVSDKEEVEKEDGKKEEDKSKLKKLEFMAWTDANDFESLKAVYAKVFKDKSALIHAAKINFEITQKNKTGINLPVYFEAIVFFPEVFDMRIFGINHDGEFHFFVSGMKVTLPKIESEFLKPFSAIVRSTTALTTSTREELMNKEDEQSVINGIEKALIPIIHDMMKSEDRGRVITSYNHSIKSGALVHKKNKNKIAKKVFELTVFENVDGELKTMSEICESAEDKEVFYTDVPSKLVKMRNGVVNPNFDNTDVKFFFVSGLIDQQLVNMFKECKGKKIRNLSTKEFTISKYNSNEEFEEWAKSFLGNFVSDVEVTKKLKTTPFCLRLKEDAINSSLKQMMGENSVESSPFRSMFRNLPILEYNPSCQEFKNLIELKNKNEALAENTLKAYIVAISAVSMCDINDKVGSYISLTNICKNILNIDLVSDEKSSVKKDDDYEELRKERQKKREENEKNTANSERKKDAQADESSQNSKKKSSESSKPAEDKKSEDLNIESEKKVETQHKNTCPKPEGSPKVPQDKEKEENSLPKMADISPEKSKIREEL